MRQISLLILLVVLYKSCAVSLTEYNQHELLQEHPIHEPSAYKPPIPILKQSFQLDPHGYKFSYKTANGIEAEEVGVIKNKGIKDHETIVQQGKVTYHDEHGQPITLTYVADEHGFQPQGDHLPTPPPLPPILEKAFAEHAEAYLQEQEYHQKYAPDYPEAEEEISQQHLYLQAQEHIQEGEEQHYTQYS